MTEILLGTQGWSYPDWVGSFYPPGTRASEFLSLYSQSFSTVELDTTFYAVPRPAYVDGWRQRTPAGFRFAAKLPQEITHVRRLADVEDRLTDFLAVITRLEDRLGPLLAQLPPDFSFGEEEWRNVQRFVRLLPASLEFALEFRHRSWAREEVFDLLRKHEVAWCVPDLPYLPAVVEPTARFAYVRWLGDHRKVERFAEPSIERESDYDRWSGTLRAFSSQVTRIYGYFNNHYSGHSPSSVRALQRRLGLPESLPPARGLFDN